MHRASAHRFLAVYLTLLGYFGDAYAGAVLMNSNAIKNLPGASAGKVAETVSPTPRTSPPGRMGHKLPVDTLQVRISPCVKVKTLCANSCACLSFIRSMSFVTLCLFLSCLSSQVFALMTKSAEAMSSAMTPEAPACPAVRAGNVAQETPCVVQETDAATVSFRLLQ